MKIIIYASTFFSNYRHIFKNIEVTLSLLVRAMYIYCCSSRTSRSLWITQSTQRQRRGCNRSSRDPKKDGKRPSGWKPL